MKVNITQLEKENRRCLEKRNIHTVAAIIMYSCRIIRRNVILKQIVY